MMHAYASLDPAAHPPTLAPDYKSSLNRAPREPLVRIPQTATEGVFARGLLNRLVTRVYFEDAAENERDPVLSLIPAARRTSLIAKRSDRPNRYGIDIVLQGENETVFFDF